MERPLSLTNVLFSLIFGRSGNCALVKINYNRPMSVDKETLRLWRLNAQHLSGRSLLQPEEVVQWLGGVQAQDYAAAKWSIGLRLPESVDADAEKALQNGRIIRTWMFRGTLHFVAASDLPWLTALLAPGIIRQNARRYKQLELDAAVFIKGEKVLQQAIEQSGPLTRLEIKRCFEKAAVPAEGQQLPYLLQRAALDGLICLGSLRGNKPTYTLVSQWVGSQTAVAAEEGYRRLAKRYFTGHGPATIDDFAWWSGLTKKEARTAIEAADLNSVNLAGNAYWFQNEHEASAVAPSGCLLPPFDEYLLGYRDRSLMLHFDHAKKVNAGGGMPKPAVVVNGKVIGIWGRRAKKSEAVISLHPFRTLEGDERNLLQEAVERWGRFTAVPVEFEVIDAGKITTVGEL